MAVTERLYKSRHDRMLAGVAGGVAEMVNADPSIVRIVWALLIVLTGGIALVVYVVMAIVVPDAPDVDPGSPGARPGGGPPPADGGRPNAGPVAPGGWRAPDGSTVPMAAGYPTTRRTGPRDPADRARGGFIAGLILILIGAFFLIRQFVPSIDEGLLWPIAVIAVGVLLAFLALLPPRRPG